jgi:hypothetical protein
MSASSKNAPAEYRPVLAWKNELTATAVPDSGAARDEAKLP